jgi:hypothetical protein
MESAEAFPHAATQAGLALGAQLTDLTVVTRRAMTLVQPLATHDSAARDAEVASDPTGTEPAVRVRFRQPVSASGFIDAAWWPRGTDLSVELPGLLRALWDADREVTRLSYHIGSWAPAPRRLRVDGRTVRLGGFNTSDPHTVRLIDSAGYERIDVLVIPPEADSSFARRALEIAGTADDPLRPGEILEQAGRDAGAVPSGAR